MLSSELHPLFCGGYGHVRLVTTRCGAKLAIQQPSVLVCQAFRDGLHRGERHSRSCPLSTLSLQFFPA